MFWRRIATGNSCTRCLLPFPVATQCRSPVSWSIPRSSSCCTSSLMQSVRSCSWTHLPQLAWSGTLEFYTTSHILVGEYITSLAAISICTGQRKIHKRQKNINCALTVCPLLHQSLSNQSLTIHKAFAAPHIRTTRACLRLHIHEEQPLQDANCSQLLKWIRSC